MLVPPNYNNYFQWYLVMQLVPSGCIVHVLDIHLWDNSECNWNLVCGSHHIKKWQLNKKMYSSWDNPEKGTWTTSSVRNISKEPALNWGENKIYLHVWLPSEIKKRKCVFCLLFFAIRMNWVKSWTKCRFTVNPDSWFRDQQAELISLSAHLI